MARNPSTILPPSLPLLDEEAFTEDRQKRAVKRFNTQLQEWFNILNGGLSLGTGPGWSGHVDGEIIDVEARVGVGVDFGIPHNLGRIPVGFILLGSTVAGGLISPQATTAHTDTMLMVQHQGVAGDRYRIMVF